MMMAIHFRIEPGGGAGMTGLGDQAKRDKGAEDAMDRHLGNLRQFPAHLCVELLSGGVIGPIQDGFKNGPTLRRDGQAAVAVCGEKIVQAPLFVSQSH